MIKYGILQQQVEELVKLGMAEEEALEVVSEGRGEQMIKTAQARRGGTDARRLEQANQDAPEETGG